MSEVLDSMLYEEIEDFGEGIGCIPIYQISQSSFNDACSTKNNTAAEDVGGDDSTGKRFYSGTFVVLRFLHRVRGFLNGKSVIEIGCGTGIVGATMSNTSSLHRMVLTDGNQVTLHIARKNVERLCPMDYERKVFVDTLFWPPKQDSPVPIHPTVASLFDRYTSGLPFDVVLGSELMYYTTDISQLFFTVRQLTADKGVFLHGHFFRKPGQIEEWMKEIESYGYSTMEVVAISLLKAQELAEHPEWYRVRVLVTAPVSEMSSVLAALQTAAEALQNDLQVVKKPLVFIPLQDEQLDYEDDDSDEQNDHGGGAMFDLFR